MSINNNSNNLYKTNNIKKRKPNANVFIQNTNDDIYDDCTIIHNNALRNKLNRMDICFHAATKGDVETTKAFDSSSSSSTTSDSTSLKSSSKSSLKSSSSLSLVRLLFDKIVSWTDRYMSRGVEKENTEAKQQTQQKKRHQERLQQKEPNNTNDSSYLHKDYNEFDSDTIGTSSNLYVYYNKMSASILLTRVIRSILCTYKHTFQNQCQYQEKLAEQQRQSKKNDDNNDYHTNQCNSSISDIVLTQAAVQILHNISSDIMDTVEKIQYQQPEIQPSVRRSCRNSSIGHRDNRTKVKPISSCTNKTAQFNNNYNRNNKNKDSRNSKNDVDYDQDDDDDYYDYQEYNYSNDVMDEEEYNDSDIEDSSLTCSWNLEDMICTHLIEPFFHHSCHISSSTSKNSCTNNANPIIHPALQELFEIAWDYYRKSSNSKDTNNIYVDDDDDNDDDGNDDAHAHAHANIHSTNSNNANEVNNNRPTNLVPFVDLLRTILEMICTHTIGSTYTSYLDFITLWDRTTKCISNFDDSINSSASRSYFAPTIPGLLGSLQRDHDNTIKKNNDDNNSYRYNHQSSTTASTSKFAHNGAGISNNHSISLLAMTWKLSSFWFQHLQRQEKARLYQEQIRLMQQQLLLQEKQQFQQADDVDGSTTMAQEDDQDYDSEEIVEFKILRERKTAEMIRQQRLLCSAAALGYVLTIQAFVQNYSNDSNAHDDIILHNCNSNKDSTNSTASPTVESNSVVGTNNALPEPKQANIRMDKETTPECILQRIQDSANTIIDTTQIVPDADGLLKHEIQTITLFMKEMLDIECRILSRSTIAGNSSSVKRCRTSAQRVPSCDEVLDDVRDKFHDDDIRLTQYTKFRRLDTPSPQSQSFVSSRNYRLHTTGHSNFPQDNHTAVVDDACLNDPITQPIIQPQSKDGFHIFVNSPFLRSIKSILLQSSSLVYMDRNRQDHDDVDSIIESLYSDYTSSIAVAQKLVWYMPAMIDLAHIRSMAALLCSADLYIEDIPFIDELMMTAMTPNTMTMVTSKKKFKASSLMNPYMFLFSEGKHYSATNTTYNNSMKDDNFARTIENTNPPPAAAATALLPPPRTTLIVAKNNTKSLTPAVITEGMELNEWTVSVMNLELVKPSRKLRQALVRVAKDNCIDPESPTAAAPTGSAVPRTEDAPAQDDESIVDNPILHDMIVPVLNHFLDHFQQQSRHGQQRDGTTTSASSSVSRIKISTECEGQQRLGYLVNTALGGESTFDMLFLRGTVAFYYHALEAILFYESDHRSSKRKNMALGTDVSFYRALLCCCLASVTKAIGVLTGSRTVSSLQGHTFSTSLLLQLCVTTTDKTERLLQATGCVPYDFVMMKDLFLSSMTYESARTKLGSPIVFGLPRILRKHLMKMEILILDSILWSTRKINHDSRHCYSAEKGELGSDRYGSSGSFEAGALFPHIIENIRDCANQNWSPNCLTATIMEELEDEAILKPNAAFLGPFQGDSSPFYDFSVTLRTDVDQVFQKTLSLAYSRIEVICSYLSIPAHYPILTQVWLAFRYLLRYHIHMLYDRHVDHWILCSIYGVSRAVRYQPELSFRAIMDSYLAIRGPEVGEEVCHRTLQYVQITRPTCTNNPSKSTRGFSHIIDLYNDVFLPIMKNYLANSVSIRRSTKQVFIQNGKSVLKFSKPTKIASAFDVEQDKVESDTLNTIATVDSQMKNKPSHVEPHPV